MRPFVGEANSSHLAFIRRKSESMNVWFIWSPGGTSDPPKVDMEGSDKVVTIYIFVQEVKVFKSVKRMAIFNRKGFLMGTV
jgi:hypothetical protein